MDDFVNVIKRNPKVQPKMKFFLDKYNRLHYNYQSKIGYDSLFQNVILKELIRILSVTIMDLYIEIEMKISRIKYLETTTNNIRFQRN